LNNIVTLKTKLEVTQRSLKMVPFESFGTVSYSIATMAVSLAVLTQYTNVRENSQPDIQTPSQTLPI